MAVEDCCTNTLRPDDPEECAIVLTSIDKTLAFVATGQRILRVEYVRNLGIKPVVYVPYGYRWHPAAKTQIESCK